MGGYLAYTEYKDSGVEWLGEIPAHWQLKKLHHVARLRSGETMTAQMMNENDEFPVYGGNGLRGYFNSYTHDGDYVLIGRQGALCGNINYASGKFWASEHAVVVSPTCHLETFWLGELLRSMNLNQYSTSAAQPGISVEQIGRLRIPFPPTQEQQSIARFLDYKTAQIDALIAKKESLLEKLAEKRTALISQAVTKGLDRTVPMKDSGVEWLGEIPEHWSASKLKYVTHLIIDGTHFTPTYINEGIPFLRVTDIVQSNMKEINLDIIKFISQEEHKLLSRRCKPEKGDLLYSKNGTIGVPRVIDWDFEFSIFVSLCLIKIDKTKLEPDFLAYSLLGKSTENQITIGAKSNTVTNLHLDKIKEFWVCLPPLEEQGRIVAGLNDITEEINISIQTIKTAIAKLKEYRTALITNAVTGKIDVRDVKLPELDPLEAA